ncbi:MAG: hypothetical protein ABJF11_12085 [Reichenbachiella sp.]|uniref:hypothetical protein n=1 Tax=Reichenbachiella sp. TaxID=2184521 RepID=UPI003262F101
MSIEFQTLSRGYFEKIMINADSLIFEKKQRGETEITSSLKSSRRQWKSVISDLSSIVLDSVPILQSPTNKRTYDGARHSELIINTDQKSFRHQFDDEAPHAKLLPLLNCLIRLKNEF